MGKTLPDLEVMEMEKIPIAMTITMVMKMMMSVMVESLDHFTTLT